MRAYNISRYGGGIRIEYDGGPLEPGRDLREQLKPLASQRGFQGAEAGDVPPRLVETRDDAACDGVGHACKDDRNRPSLPLDGSGGHAPACQDDVGLQADQLLRERSCSIDVIAEPSKVHSHVAAIGPTQVRKRLRERRDATLLLGIVFVAPREHADAPHAVALLRPRRERPCCRAAEERDELAPLNHSITSSARPDSGSGTVMPSALAVLRLMISSTLVTCWTGRSAGFSPLRMRPV